MYGCLFFITFVLPIREINPVTHGDRNSTLHHTGNRRIPYSGIPSLCDSGRRAGGILDRVWQSTRIAGPFFNTKMTPSEVQVLKKLMASSLKRYTKAIFFLLDYCETGSDYRRMKKQGQTRDDLFESMKKFMREVKSDKTWLEDLEAALNLMEDGLIDRFKEDFSGNSDVGEHMDDLDYFIVPMAFAGVHTRLIAYYTGLSNEAIRMRKSRYRRKFRNLGNENSADYLDAMDDKIKR